MANTIMFEGNESIDEVICHYRNFYESAYMMGEIYGFRNRYRWNGYKIWSRR